MSKHKEFAPRICSTVSSWDERVVFLGGIRKYLGKQLAARATQNALQNINHTHTGLAIYLRNRITK